MVYEFIVGFYSELFHLAVTNLETENGLFAG